MDKKPSDQIIEFHVTNDDEKLVKTIKLKSGAKMISESVISMTERDRYMDELDGVLTEWLPPPS